MLKRVAAVAGDAIGLDGGGAIVNGVRLIRQPITDRDHSGRPCPVFRSALTWSRLATFGSSGRILKHLDGDLTIHPRASEAPTAKRARAGHPFEISGRIKHNSLLAVNQEAACATLVAGAGFEPATFGL